MAKYARISNQALCRLYEVDNAFLCQFANCVGVYDGQHRYVFYFFIDNYPPRYEQQCLRNPYCLCLNDDNRRGDNLGQYLAIKTDVDHQE